MKKSLMRAAMVACLPFCAIALTVATAPAQAADKATAPSVSKSVAKQLGDCKKAYEAKDYATAIAKCTEAKNTPDTTDWDKYVTDRYLGMAYFAAGDQVKAGDAFYAVLKNPACTVEDQQHLVAPAMGLAADHNDYPRVIELGLMAVKGTITNPDVYGTLAGAYYYTNDTPNAILYTNKGIDLATAQNKIPAYNLYQILIFSYDKAKDRPNELKSFDLIARDYGKADDWKNLLDLSLEFLPKGNKSMAEIAALDLYRLRLVLDVTWQPTNYEEAADAAHAARSWGDERTVLQMGIAKGVIDAKKVAPMLAQTNADAKRDEPALPQVEKIAKDAKGLANVAEAYYGYGRYADAARVAQKAIDAGGPFAAEGKLVLAMSQVRLGNEAAAKQALAGFQGDPALTRAAQLWTVYLDRRYGAAAPAAAPAAAH